MSRLKVFTLTGLALVLVSIVVGFVPVSSEGRSCGSVLAPGRHNTQLCKDARGDLLPFVVVPLVIAALLLIPAFIIWVRSPTEDMQTDSSSSSDHQTDEE